MKKLLLPLVALILLLYSCVEQPTAPVRKLPQPKLPPYPFATDSNLMICYLYGDCYIDWNFIAPKERLLLYERGKFVNGIFSYGLTLWDNRRTNLLGKARIYHNPLSWPSDSLFIFSKCYQPFVEIPDYIDYFPEVWQPLNLPKGVTYALDTIVDGEYFFPATSGEPTLVLPAKFEYKVLAQGFGTKGQAICNDITLTRIYIERIVHLPKEFGTKFERNPLRTDLNYDEFYFNDDYSAFLDKIEIRCKFSFSTFGIVELQIVHRRLGQTRLYRYLQDHYLIGLN